MVALLNEAEFDVLVAIPLAYLNHEKKNDLVCVAKKRRK